MWGGMEATDLAIELDECQKDNSRLQAEVKHLRAINRRGTIRELIYISVLIFVSASVFFGCGDSGPSTFEQESRLAKKVDQDAPLLENVSCIKTDEHKFECIGRDIRTREKVTFDVTVSEDGRYIATPK